MDRLQPTPTVPTLRDIRQHRESLLAEAARCGLENVRVFGSVARTARVDAERNE